MKDNNHFPLSAPEESRSDDREDQALVTHKTDWLRIGQFVFSGLAALLLLGLFLVSTLASLLQHSFSSAGFPIGSELSPYLFSAGLGGMGLLMIPSAVCAGRQLFTQGPSRSMRWGNFTRIGYIAAFAILLGFIIQNAPAWTKGFLPIVHVLANSAAVFWLLGLARRKLPDQSASRFWGTFAAGLGLTPLVTFILEILILIGIGLAWMAVLGMMPELRQDFMDLVARLQSSSADQQVLQAELDRFAARPGVLITLFSYVAFLIPVVEELLKPAAVYLLLRRKLQPWEGFVIGATSGAGYALFENLTIGAAADAWTFVTVTRLGTAAVHIFTAGLMGWGLVSALIEKRYGRLAVTFFAAVLLHGTWNGLNILAAVGGFVTVRDQLGSLGASLADFAPLALILIALGCFWGLIRMNKYFRRAIIAGSN